MTIYNEEQQRAARDLGYILSKLGVDASKMIDRAESWEDWSQCPCCTSDSMYGDDEDET